MGGRGARRNCNCRRLGFQNMHPYKRPIRFFDPDLKIIDASQTNKYTRGPSQLPAPVEEPFFAIGADFFEAEPNTGVVTTTLADVSSIYTAGIVTSGSTANIGVFRGGAAPEGGDAYRVDANNQGLFIRNPFKLFPIDTGQMTVWLKPHDAGGSGTANTIFNVNDNLVVRWESGTEELRLYPDLTNFSSDYLSLDLPRATWFGDATWHKYRIGWKYQDQEWTLRVDEGANGVRAGSSTITHPNWDVFSNISIFTDIENTNNVYHDTAFLSFGPHDIDDTLDEGCSACCYQIDATSGSNSTYGLLVGNFDGSNLGFQTSLGYSENTLEIWLNSDKLTRNVDYVETDPGNGLYTLSGTAPVDGESMVAGYVPEGENCPDALFVVAVTSGSGVSTSTPSPAHEISGSIGLGNTAYKLPFPYVQGKVFLKWQGMILNQGNDSDWQEDDPWLGTVALSEELIGPSVLTAEFIPVTRYKETTNDTVSGVTDGSNTDFGLSYMADIRNAEIDLNGQMLTDGIDFTFVTNRLIRMTTAPSSGSGEIIGATYDILFRSLEETILPQQLDSTNDGDILTTEQITLVVNTSSGAVGLTFPDAYSSFGHTWNVKKVGSANRIDLSGSGSQLIDGQSTLSIIFENDCANIQAAGSAGLVIK